MMNAKINLIIGLPVEVVEDRREAQAVLRKLRAWAVGDHQFKVNNQPLGLTIQQIKAIAQPVGAYFAWGAGLNGHWLLSPEARSKPTAIADIGYNTVDLFGVDNGQVARRATGGDTLGMHRVADILIRHARSHYDVSLSLYEADRLMRQYLAEGQAILYHTGGETNLGPVIEQALDDAFAAISRFIRQHWEQGTQFRHLLLTGGGAQALRERLLNQYPQAIILPNAVTANAEGMARFALRAGIFNEPADRSIALDPGFGGFKVAEVRGEQVFVDVIPAVVGIGTTDLGYLTTGLRGRRANKPLTVRFDALSYLVGPNVHLYARPAERLDFKRLSDGPELRALFYAALWQVLQ
jgi:hypothetical protein